MKRIEFIYNQYSNDINKDMEESWYKVFDNWEEAFKCWETYCHPLSDLSKETIKDGGYHCQTSNFYDRIVTYTIKEIEVH